MSRSRPEDRRADRDWEDFARRDAYWAVLTERRYLGSGSDPTDRDAFFAAGNRHLESVLATRAYLLGAARPPRRAMDFGCGVGRLLPALARSCFEVVGVDVSATMIAEAEVNCRRMAIDHVDLVCDSDELALVEGDFDFIHSTLVFQHIRPERGERIFASLCRKLRRGGVAALQFTVGSNQAAFERRLAAWRELVPPLRWLFNLWAGKPLGEPVMRMYVYSRDRLESVAREQGCRVVDVQPLPVPSYDSVMIWIGRD